jgi:hypothetical protein
VFYPLMPKGVEHNRSVLRTYHSTFVIYPLMPKGVEHLTRATARRTTVVIYPLMPKGVEHALEGEGKMMSI